jgi:hypothetical protein
MLRPTVTAPHLDSTEAVRKLPSATPPQKFDLTDRSRSDERDVRKGSSTPESLLSELFTRPRPEAEVGRSAVPDTRTPARALTHGLLDLFAYDYQDSTLLGPVHGASRGLTTSCSDRPRRPFAELSVRGTGELRRTEGWPPVAGWVGWLLGHKAPHLRSSTHSFRAATEPAIEYAKSIRRGRCARRLSTVKVGTSSRAAEAFHWVGCPMQTQVHSYHPKIGGPLAKPVHRKGALFIG